ncbi:hepatitis A virus cellular receptor 1 [Hyalella azteca]|uniref:Hepatitis A virus cellular receptor 1 n=1 Tax=Hyalella azteca TaxID=294128 RepID=A0A8B7NA39_HYAAZ|nr:hepatitis A virus cellular receptor 1 [Hyalella azteca]
MKFAVALLLCALVAAATGEYQWFREVLPVFYSSCRDARLSSGQTISINSQAIQCTRVLCSEQLPTSLSINCVFTYLCLKHNTISTCTTQKSLSTSTGMARLYSLLPYRCSVTCAREIPPIETAVAATTVTTTVPTTTTAMPTTTTEVPTTTTEVPTTATEVPTTTTEVPTTTEAFPQTNAGY